MNRRALCLRLVILADRKAIRTMSNPAIYTRETERKVPSMDSVCALGSYLFLSRLTVVHESYATEVSGSVHIAKRVASIAVHHYQSADHPTAPGPGVRSRSFRVAHRDARISIAIAIATRPFRPLIAPRIVFEH